jgi:hypothetical protein
LTATGLAVGILQLRRRSSGRWIPYQGLHFWHHALGLTFGVFTLAWVASGLLSMNPWGLLEGDAVDEPANLRGAPITADSFNDYLARASEGAVATDIVSIESAPLRGLLYAIVTRAGGERIRVNAQGQPQQLTDGDFEWIGRTLDSAHRGHSIHEITAEDDYYFSHHLESAALPAIQIITQDPGGSRYYIDPVSGTLWAKFDLDARRYRWLHQAPHRLDFSPIIRQRPLWDVLVLALLAGVTALCSLGLFLGIRSLKR